MSIVLDVSVALAWCFEDEASTECDAIAERVGDEGAVVPALWHLELGNVLLQAERRGRIAMDDIHARLDLLRAMPIKIDTETAGRAWTDILLLAHSEMLTTYDAAYLELALRLRAPLATRDKQLIAAALKRGVVVLS